MIKIAIIGCGGIGKFHSTVYKLLPEARVIAVADIRREHALKAAESHDAKVYTTMEDLLSHEEPDVIDICTPTYLHPEMILSTLQAGFHVLCEKPLALDLAQAQAVVSTSQHSRGIFMVAQVIRFWDEYAFVKKSIEANTFGSIKQAWFSRTASAPLWSWENWFLDESRSGLAPFDLHIHDADFIHYLFGTPQSVRSVGILDSEKPELSFLRTEYHYDGIGPVGAEGGWFPARIPFLAAFRVVFDKAILDFRSDGELMCFPIDSEPYAVSIGAEIKAPSTINIDSVRPYYNEISYFLECIKSGKNPVVVTPEESLSSLEMLLAEVRSVKSGESIFL